MKFISNIIHLFNNMNKKQKIIKILEAHFGDDIIHFLNNYYSENDAEKGELLDLARELLNEKLGIEETTNLLMNI